MSQFLQQFGIGNILALVGISFVGFLAKISLGRAYKDILAQLKVVSDKVAQQDEKIETIEKDYIRITEQLKKLPDLELKSGQIANMRMDIKMECMERYLQKGDFIRETQILSNQTEAIHKKIDSIDAKIEKMKETARR